MSEPWPQDFVISGMPVYVDPNVPLQRTKDDGTVEDALFWIIDGKILVHPARREMFDRIFSRPESHPTNSGRADGSE